MKKTAFAMVAAALLAAGGYYYYSAQRSAAMAKYTGKNINMGAVGTAAAEADCAAATGYGSLCVTPTG